MALRYPPLPLSGNVLEGVTIIKAREGIDAYRFESQSMECKKWLVIGSGPRRAICAGYRCPLPSTVVSTTPNV